MVITRDPAFDPSAFVGRTYALNWLGNKLSAMQHCNLIGEPRVGKTSLLAQVKNQKLAGDDVTYVWVRLVESPAHDSHGFWQFLSARFCEATGHTLVSVPKPSGLFDWLEGTIGVWLENGRSLLFLLDDFDLLQLKSRDLDWLRALATRYQEQLAFVISTTNSLVAHTRALTGDVSPLTNIFHNLQLSLLKHEEANQLITNLVPDLPTEQQTNLLLETGPHPDLIKVACGYYLDGVEDVSIELRLDEHVRWLCEQLWQRRTAEEQSYLRAFAHHKHHDPLRLRQMERLGLLKKQPNGNHQFFSFVFAFWLDMWWREEGESAEATPSPIPDPEIPVLLVHQPKARLVQIGQTQVKLTPLENRLFTYLHDHANQVCTIQELLDNVWGANRTESVVEKAINRLRQKIEVDAKRPRYILSARGEGYLLRMG